MREIDFVELDAMIKNKSFVVDGVFAVLDKIDFEQYYEIVMERDWIQHDVAVFKTNQQYRFYLTEKDKFLIEEMNRQRRPYVNMFQQGF